MLGRVLRRRQVPGAVFDPALQRPVEARDSLFCPLPRVGHLVEGLSQVAQLASRVGDLGACVEIASAEPPGGREQRTHRPQHVALRSDDHQHQHQEGDEADGTPRALEVVGRGERDPLVDADRDVGVTRLRATRQGCEADQPAHARFIGQA